MGRGPESIQRGESDKELGNSYNCVRSHSVTDEQQTSFRSAIQAAFDCIVDKGGGRLFNVFCGPASSNMNCKRGRCP